VSNEFAVEGGNTPSALRDAGPITCWRGVLAGGECEVPKVEVLAPRAQRGRRCRWSRVAGS
jgi:hypothetical protein